MGLFSQCCCCETWKKRNDRYRKQSSPRAHLPGNIEKSLFVYSPKLSPREDYLFRPSIQQLAQQFAEENLKIEKPIGLPLSSYYLDLPYISLESLEPRTTSLELRTTSLEPRTRSVQPRSESLQPSEVGVSPKETKLINVKPAKESIYHVQETDADLNDIQLTTDISQVVDHQSEEEQEQFKEPRSRLDVKSDNYRSLTSTQYTMSTARYPSRRRYMYLDNSNNNVSSDIPTIILQESSFNPLPKPRPDTMFCVTRDKAWRGQSTTVTDIKPNKKKGKKDILF